MKFQSETLPGGIFISAKDNELIYKINTNTLQCLSCKKIGGRELFCQSGLTTKPHLKQCKECLNINE